jgi:tetratricopeptide (TPR) repeat protein
MQTENKRRAGDLRARAALLALDGQDGVARALSLVDKIDHPLAWAVQLAVALEPRGGAGATTASATSAPQPAVDPEAVLAACVAEARRRGDRDDLADLGGLLLFRSGRAADAAELLKQAASPEDPLIARTLAFAAAGQWAALVELLAQPRTPTPPGPGKEGAREDELDALLVAAAVADDRLSDARRAEALLQRALDRAERAPQASAAVLPHLIERLVELGSREGGSTLPRALRARLAALAPLGDAARAERAVTQLLLALACERGGELSESATALGDIDGAGLAEPSLGVILALRTRARVEASRGDHRAAAEAWEALAQVGSPSPLPGWSEAALRRAAEIYLAKAGDAERAERLFAKLHAARPADLGLTLWLTLIRLSRGGIAAAVDALAAHGRARGAAGWAALGLAARAAEALPSAGDVAAERVVRWREAIDAEERGRAQGNGGRNSLEGLARAYRRLHNAEGRSHLVGVYRRLGAVLDARRASAYLAVAGVLCLDLGQQGEAEQAFKESAEREPDDLLLHAGRAMLFRRAARYSDLSAALSSLISLVRSKEAKARLYRQLAQVGERLGDTTTAQQSYERALDLEPEHVTTLHAFSRLCSETGRWAKAVELDERAVQSAQGERAAELLCEIGDIYVRRLSDDDKGRNAYERALERDERCLPALEALAILHRRHRRVPELLDVLRRQLKLASDKERQLELYLEVGRVAGDARDAATVELALSAYRDALRIDPASAPALAGIEKLCQREGRWDLLSEVLRRAPATVRNLRALADAASRLERWEEVAEARERELALLTEPREVVRTARALAELYEGRLNDLDAAARAWHRVDEADGRDGEAARALQRIYEARGRFADLAAAIERELSLDSTETNVDPARRLELWLRLGEIRRARLSRPESAAEAYEKALELDAQNADALAALADIYAAARRAADLNRVLDLRARATTDPQQRAAVLLQKGELLERSADLEGALTAYGEAFQLDPASRTCFTAYERVCYRLERWRNAMELYETAIRLVEVQRSRAYRLADLYARRGQVQLQYLGQPGEAAASYLRVLELDPESDTAQAALERIFSAQSDWVGLIGAYERRAELVKDDGKRVEILRRAARVAAAKLKDAGEAARLYGRLHAVDPTDTEALDALERHSERTRDWERLVGILTTRLSLTAGGDEAIQLYLRIAQLCEEGLRDADRAIESYKKILDIAPSHKEAIEALARLYEGTEKWVELIDVTRRQIRIVTDRAQKALLYFKCGSVMESKFGKEDDAIRYYDAAIKTSPSCLPAVHGLRDLYLRREDWPRVIQTLELEAKLWTEDKERAGVFAHIGQIYGDKLGDQDRAIQYYESALTVDRECLPANRALFELYFARQEYRRALPIAVILTQKVTREGDPVERSEFYRKRSVVASETGDARAAAESLVVALEIRPDNLQALDLLVGLCRTHGDAYDFQSTFRELEKLYRKQNSLVALARVLVAQGALRERQYDIDGAEQLYIEAVRLAPDQINVVEPLVSLHEKLRRFEAGAAVLEAFVERASGPEHQAARSRARLRLAELHGDGAMDARAAALTLEELLEEDPDNREAHYLLAQSLYLLGRYAEAHRACERLIQLAAAPGRTAPPEELARYYDYLGRIADAAGDTAGAGRAYRRAIDLDPAYAPSVLALARRAASANDRAGAQAILDAALEAATGRGWQVEMPLRRAFARFYISVGEPARAIAESRNLILRATDPATGHAAMMTAADLHDLHNDRVALAELLATSPATVAQAREELLAVLAADLRHVPAYRLLMTIYQRTGELERASRVANMLQLLGYVEPGDRGPSFRASVRRGTITDEQRRTRLLPPLSGGVQTEALVAVREALDTIYPPPPVPGAVPVAQLADPAIKVCAVDAQRLFGTNAEIYLAPEVPGGTMAFDGPRPLAFIQASLVEKGDEGERRFLLGRALEPLRGGYAIIFRLKPQQRVEVGMLIAEICRPDSERSQAAQDLVRALSRKAQKALERVVQMAQSSGFARLPIAPTADPSAREEAERAWAAQMETQVQAWLTALALGADRAGLLSCDDVGAAARALARLSGEDLLATGSLAAGGLTVGQVPSLVPGVGELVRFFLSDAYHDLRIALGTPSQVGSATSSNPVLG